MWAISSILPMFCFSGAGEGEGREGGGGGEVLGAVGVQPIRIEVMTSNAMIVNEKRYFLLNL